MEIRVKIDEISYGDLVAKFLPLIGEKLQEKDGTASKILAGLAKLPPSIAKTTLDALPESTKDEIAILLINKNKDKIIISATDYCRKNEVAVTISDLTVSE